MLRIILLLSFIISFSAFPISADTLGNEKDISKEAVHENDPISFKILSDVDAISPDLTFLVGIEITPKEGWKSYWKNPGEAGDPLHLKWDLPEGFEAKELEWPAPERDLHNDMVTFGYHKPFVLITEIKAPKNLSATEVPLKVLVEWVLCSSEECLPGETPLQITLPVAASVAKDPSKLEAALKMIPQKTEGVSVEVDGDEVSLIFPVHLFDAHVDEVHFFPSQEGVIDIRDEETLAEVQGNYHLYFKKTKEPLPSKLEGVISMISRAPEIQKSFFISAPVPSESEVSLVPFREKESLLWTLFFSIIGGLLLNVMPCVLPVISLKVMSFVKLSQESRRLTLFHGVAFSLGVILSFLALGALLFILRAMGMEVGWGFQLQDPTFVALLAGLILLMALLFFGVYEIGGGLVSKVGALEHQVKKKTPSLFSSFASGILATALSTPCSGPFIGTALGLSMTLPPHLGMLIFLAMGFGMALPYLLLSWEPRWLRFIPKPGPWMDTFKEVMGFFLLLTVVWLMWVYVAQARSGEILSFFFALFTISLGAWVFGKYGSIFRSPKVRFIGRLAAALLLTYSVVLLVMVGRETAKFRPEDRNSAVIENGWEVFSPERLTALRKEGVPVFLDFTAKWCLICQSNFVVVESEKVQRGFEKLGVVKMEADWTRNDPEITRALASFGRNSVPLYVYYPPGKESQPIILPQLLTPGNILETIEK